MRLQEFITKYNNRTLDLFLTPGQYREKFADLSGWLIEDYENIIKPHKQKLRATFIHMPALCQVLINLGYVKTNFPLAHQIVHLTQGNIFERLLIYLMREHEVELSDYHKELEFKGVTGTIDYCLEGVLTDFKTMSGRYVTDFARYPYANISYCYQLLFYKNVLQRDKAQWLVFDKWENLLYLVPFQNPEMEQEFLRRMDGLFVILQQTKTIYEAFDSLPIPEIKDAKVPFYLQHTVWQELFYRKVGRVWYIRPTQHIIKDIEQGIQLEEES